MGEQGETAEAMTEETQLKASLSPIATTGNSSVPDKKRLADVFG